jgi:hypothetical protein
MGATTMVALSIMAPAGGALRFHEPTVGGTKRIEALADALAAHAATNLAEAVWLGSVSPVLSIAPALGEEIDERLALEILLQGHRERPRAVWLALRQGHDPRRGREGRDSGRIPHARAEGDPWSDEDLEHACAILVREALLARVAANVRLPAEAVRDFLARAPNPLPNPGIEAHMQRRARRLEVSGRLAPSVHAEARGFIEDFERRQAVAEGWRARYERMMLEVQTRAEGDEARALVELALRVGLARAGWPPQPARTMTGRISQAANREDPVLVAVRRARGSGSDCTLLRDALDALRPISVERIDAIVISADARVRVGRSNATLAAQAIDSWRREVSMARASARGTRRRRAAPTERPRSSGRSADEAQRIRRTTTAETKPMRRLTLRFSRCRDPTSASCDRCSFPASARRGSRALDVRGSCSPAAEPSGASSPSNLRVRASGC